MIGAYAEEQRSRPTDRPATQAAAEVLAEPSRPCHNTPSRAPAASLADERGVSFWQPSLSNPRLNTSRHIVFNLSRPDKSLLLLAPLAEAAGGWGLCRDPNRRKRPLSLRALETPATRPFAPCALPARSASDKIKRFDMPGFRPRKDWVREMVRFGILRTGRPRLRPAYGRLCRRTKVLAIPLVSAGYQLARTVPEGRTTDFFGRSPCRLKAALRFVAERRLSGGGEESRPALVPRPAPQGHFYSGR